MKKLIHIYACDICAQRHEVNTVTYGYNLRGWLTSIESPKFSQYTYYKKYCKGYLPRLLNVPGYDGILIHRGSSANSSAGCIIVGFNTIKGKVTNSQKAWEKLMKEYLMPAKVLGEKITYTITRKYKVQ